MASSVTLAQLRADARLYADQRPETTESFVTPTELTRLVNVKARELYDMLVSARGAGYYATETTFTITDGTSRYSLPADFYELASVTLEWSPQDHELMFPVGSTRLRVAYEANWKKWNRHNMKAYQLRASQIEFLPVPSGNVTCRLQYVPVFVDMVNDSDTFDGINGWEKMIALGVAIELRTIAKMPSADLAGLYQEQVGRIDSLKSERDAEAPLEIVDEQRLRERQGWLGRTFGNSFGRTFG